MPGRKLLIITTHYSKGICIGKRIEHITHYWESIRLCKLQHCRHRSRWGEVVSADGGTSSWSTIQDTVRYRSQIIRIFQVKWYWRILMSFDIYVMSVQCENLSMSSSILSRFLDNLEWSLSRSDIVLSQWSIWPFILHAPIESHKTPQEVMWFRI